MQTFTEEILKCFPLASRPDFWQVKREVVVVAAAAAVYSLSVTLLGVEYWYREVSDSDSLKYIGS